MNFMLCMCIYICKYICVSVIFLCDCVFVCVHVCVCVCACVWGECVICSSIVLVDLNYLLICSLVRHMFKMVRMTSVTMARRLQRQRTGNQL